MLKQQQYQRFQSEWKQRFSDSTNQQYEEVFGQPRPDLRGRKWFEILAVPAGADKAIIKSAWRQLAKRYHPDRAGGSHERMAAINAAKDAGLAGAGR